MNKELKTQDKQIKNISLVDILNLLKIGKNPTQISKELQISIQRLNYHLSKLKQRGAIQKIGYGVWEVNPIEELKISTQATKVNSNNIRGHAFMWKLKFKKINKIDWKRRLIEKNISFEEKGISKTPRIQLREKKIWLGQKHVIIYESKSFFAINAIESRKFAIYELLETLRELEKVLGIELKDFEFTVCREHYSLVKNILAIQCNKAGEKINVFNEKGQWFSIDNSFNLGEMETLGSMENKPMETNLQVQTWWNGHKSTDFKVTPQFILNGFKNLQEDRVYYSENIKSHVKAIQELGSGVRLLTEKVQSLGKGTFSASEAKLKVKRSESRNQSKIGEFL